jgi:hypothetical protein
MDRVIAAPMPIARKKGALVRREAGAGVPVPALLMLKMRIFPTALSQIWQKRLYSFAKGVSLS